MMTDKIRQHEMNAKADQWRNSFSISRCIHPLLILFCIILVIQSTSAQIQLYPVQRKNPIPKTVARKNSTARIQDTPLSLPFWDDFSFTPINDPADTFSSYPLRTLWEKSENVWVNNGLGANAPTINVASFDGLDSLGLPYSDQILLNGFRDDLTSLPIKMTEVPLANRNSVFLSFFYQWQGNGEPPDENDFLRVEFKNTSGSWIPVCSIYPKSSFDRTAFYDTIVQVANDTSFFYDDFQFRFRNYGRKSGPFDTWNIDYVYLNQGRTIGNDSYPDRAVASTISQLFGDYHAVPIDHFFENKLLGKVKFDIQNLKGFDVIALSVNYSASANFKNYVNGNLSTSSVELIDTAYVNGSGAMFPYERATVEVPNTPDGNDILQFNPDADSIEVNLKVNVRSGDETDALRFNFVPIDLRINDTLSARFTLDNYYAYDDGTAEYAAGLTNSGIKMAYAFDLVTTEADTLAGFEVYFPDFSLTANRLVNFYVYSDNNGVPNSAKPLTSKLNYTVARKGINTFQRILISPVKVKGRFYIAYESPFVQIGLDISHDTGNKIFTDKAGPWEQNTQIVGSLMLRPLFIKGVDFVTGIDEEKSLIRIYPNPSEGEFYIDGRAEVIDVMAITGQKILFDIQDAGDNQRISLQQRSPGLYIVRMKEGDSYSAHKIVVR